MKKSILMTLLLSSSIYAGGPRPITYPINDGTYLGDKCFLKVETKEDRTVLQFAHKDFLISGDNDLTVILGERRSDIIVTSDIYNPQVAFTPQNVPGISVIIDKKYNWVEFGPASCNKKLANLKTIKKKYSWQVKCGSKFSRVNVNLKLYADNTNDLTHFEFSEKYNKSRRIIVRAPWKEKTIFDLKCLNMKRQETTL